MGVGQGVNSSRLSAPVHGPAGHTTFRRPWACRAWACGGWIVRRGVGVPGGPGVAATPGDS